jgi:hypothetical protein
MGIGVLTQPLGSWNWAVAYLSKKLDPVASGWPPCLWALTTAVLLIQETDKLTLGQQITPSNLSAQWHCQLMDDWGTSGQISGFIGRELPGMSRSSENIQSHNTATKRKDAQMGLHEIKKLLYNKRNGL